MNNSVPSINLFPWREQARATKRRKSLGALFCAGLVIVFIAFLSFCYIDGSIAKTKARMDYLKAQMNELQHGKKLVDEILQQKQQVVKRLKVIQDLEKKRIELVRIFDDLPRIVPDGLYLRKLDYQDGLVKIIGKAESHAQVSIFMRQIENSKVYAQPKLSQVSQQNEIGQMMKFDMSMRHQSQAQMPRAKSFNLIA